MSNSNRRCLSLLERRKKMTLTEIAEKINMYLKSFEKNPEINIVNEEYGTKLYYNALAKRVGRYVEIRYISYHLPAYLTKKEALEYLQWLNNGNIGTHHFCLKKNNK